MPNLRPFPWIPLLILTTVGVLFAAIVAEIALRVAELSQSNFVDLQCAGAGASELLQGQKGLFQLAPVAGFAMRPNICVRLRSAEYDQVLRTNSRGFVGPDVPADKARDEFRIVVLGDSYTAGGQVSYAQNYTALLEDALRGAGYAHVRVINAGVGGCGTFCRAGQFADNVAWMQPDLVVVAVFVGNNIAENVLTVDAGYRDAPEHPKGVTWGPAAAGRIPQLVAALKDAIRTDLSFTAITQLALLSRGIPSDHIQRQVLSAPRFARLGSSPDGQQLVVLPEWTSIRPAIARLLDLHDPQITDELAQRVWQENATVQVLNGSAEAGLAGRLNAYLAWQGFNLLAPSNADRSDYPTSTVTSHTAAASATAQNLANVLHAQVAASVDGASGPAITVVLGRDHPSFPDVNSP